MLDLYIYSLFVLIHVFTFVPLWDSLYMSYIYGVTPFGEPKAHSTHIALILSWYQSHLLGFALGDSRA